MGAPSPFGHWYARAGDASLGPTVSIVEAAFEDAKARFEADSADDPRMLELTKTKTNFNEVQVVVQDARDRYNTDRKDSKARKWLNRLSQRIHFYGGILDVIAQHHPEYVALVWGSIKFLLVAAINHEKIVRTLAKAITQFAEALPRVGLQSSLYPTEPMKEAVTKLYVAIFQFFARARQWYQGNGVKRFIESITHPIELRYNDLLEEVKECSYNIDSLSHCGLQAESRDAHRTVQTMRAEHKETQRTIQAMQAEQKETQRTVQTFLGFLKKINASTSCICINTNDVVSDIQFGQMMEILSRVPIVDPAKSFQYHCSLRRQRSRSAAFHAIPNNFWQSPKLQNWSCTQQSAITIVSGNYQARHSMRDFCVEIIQQLHDAAVPVLLAMKAPQNMDKSSSPSNISIVDIIKYLVRQAMTARQNVQTEKSMALKSVTIHEADTEAKWFRILEAALAELGSLVYIVIDMDILDKHLQPADGFLWVQQFQTVFDNFTTRGHATRIKVVLVSCSPLPFQLSAEDRSKFVVQARMQVLTARQRKGGRAKQMTQVPIRLKGLSGFPSKMGVFKHSRRFI